MFNPLHVIHFDVPAKGVEWGEITDSSTHAILRKENERFLKEILAKKRLRHACTVLPGVPDFPFDHGQNAGGRAAPQN
jgi:hypothetical protein